MAKLMGSSGTGEEGSVELLIMPWISQAFVDDVGCEDVL
jgi:hypothetical protein